MKFSCTKENFHQALLMVGGVAGKNSNLPILGNILLKTAAQGVEITATNLEVAITVTVRAIVEEQGLFTVPAKTLAEIVQLLSGDKVEVAVVENEALVACGKTNTKIKGSPADEFPIIPSGDDGQGLVVDREVLKTALGQVIPAVAKNDIRPELAGILWHVALGDGVPTLTLAATDSYRLAEKHSVVIQATNETKVIVPGRTAQEIFRLLSHGTSVESERSVRFLVGENQLTMRFASVQLVSRLVSGTYPDYTQIIPTNFKTSTTFSVPQLTKEIKAAGLFTTTGVNAVLLRFKPAEGAVELSSTSTQTGEYASEIAAEVQGEENSILLNHRYLLDGLNSLAGSEASLQMVGPENPCLITSQGDDRFLYIIMPIRQ